MSTRYFLLRYCEFKSEARLSSSFTLDILHYIVRVSMSAPLIVNDWASTLLSAIFLTFSQDPPTIAWVFMKFSDSLFPCSHPFRRSRSMLSAKSRSLISLAECKMLISSAYIVTLHLQKDIEKSQVYLGKMRGPRHEPCSIPQ